MLLKLSSITSLQLFIASGLMALFACSLPLGCSAAPAANSKIVPVSTSKAAVKITPSIASPAAVPASQSWTGYLIDRSCAAAIKGDAKDAVKSVKEHTKACSLEPSCCEAGYTIYTQGQWLDLDNSSSQMAKKVMQASKRDKAHVVKVVGVVKRGEIRASSIVEVI